MSISHSCPIDCSSGSYGCHDLEVWLLQGLTKEKLAQSIARFDLIIDDGPHPDEAILATFKELFPFQY